MTNEIPPAWLILALVSPVVGSFIGTVVVRNGTGQSPLRGRSQCDTCQHVLSWQDLVPLFSWLWLGRKCRYCGAMLSTFYPLVELAAVLPILWAATVLSGRLLVASALLGWLLLALALIDWRSKRLPDYLTLTLLALGIGTALAFDQMALFSHIIGAVAGYLIFAAVAALYRIVRKQEGLGLGDAKLLAGLGAWVSWEGLPAVIFLGAIADLLFVLVRSLILQQLTWKSARTERFAFGPFLALAGWIVWLYGPLMPG